MEAGDTKTEQGGKVALSGPIPGTKPVDYCYELFQALSEEDIRNLADGYRNPFPKPLEDFYRITNGMFLFGRHVRIYGVPEWSAKYKQPIALAFEDGHRTDGCPESRLFFASYNTTPETQIFFDTCESGDASRMCTPDVDVLRSMIEEIKSLDKSELTASKEDENTILEILVEMNLRGIHIKPVDIYRSAAVDFLIDDDGQILPPLNSLPGVGTNAAEAFVVIRQAGPFISMDDMLRRKVPKGVIETLRLAGCLGDMPQTSQVSLFEFEF